MFGFAMIWVGTLVGLSVSSPTLADQTTFGWLFPLTFLANTFVPTQGLPSVVLPGVFIPLSVWSPPS